MQMIYNQEAEEAFLGACLIDPSQALIDIDPKDFYIERNRVLFQAIRDVYTEKGTADFVLVSSVLEERAELNNVGGTSRMMSLLEATPSALHAPEYAQEIRAAAERRDLQLLAQDLVRDAMMGDVNHTAYIDRLTKTIRVEGGTHPLNVEDYLDYMQMRRDNPAEVWGIPTPWEKFNKVTGGLHKGRSMLIIGDSGVGKTSMVLQMGQHAAMHGYKVDFYELEMTETDLVGRMASILSGVSDERVHQGILTRDEWDKHESALKTIGGLPIRISDETHWTSSSIRADQRKKNGDRADVVIVDYLALLQDKAESPHLKVELASQALRQMAKENNQVLLSVASIVKDGSIKGTQEVKFAQDEVWRMEFMYDNGGIETSSFLKRDDEMHTNVRRLRPTKRRHSGTIAFIDLVMLPGLPKLGDRTRG